jgi:hypothetical protein
MRRTLLAVVLVAGLSLGTAGALTPVGAQQPVQVPTQEIVPQPNSGQAPTEAGDRGGALQLLVLALVVGAVGAVTWHLVRQSRRARAEA